MSYINSTLMKNEVVLYQTKPHWIVFAKPVIFLIISVLLFMFGPSFNYSLGSFAPKIPLYAMVASLSLLFAIITAISAFINFQTSEYGITNKRVLMKIGFIRRSSLEIFLQKVESVKVNQSVSGRICGYGSIIVSGVGGSKDPFDNIPNPLEFRRKVQEQIENFAETKLPA